MASQNLQGIPNDRPDRAAKQSGTIAAQRRGACIDDAARFGGAERRENCNPTERGDRPIDASPSFLANDVFP